MPEEGSPLEISFLYPSEITLTRQEFKPGEREIYVAQNPKNVDGKYLGGLIIQVVYDPSGEFYSYLQKTGRSIDTGGGFTLLEEEIIIKENIEIYFWKFFEQPDTYDMPVPGIYDRIVFRLNDWSYFINHHYPVEDEGSFANMTELFLDTVEVVK
jgi:hypothetical protein